MRSTGPLNPVGIAAFECIDVSEMFEDCRLVALLFILLVPLIVVVKNEADDIVEVVNKPVGRRRVYEAVKTAVQIGKVVKPEVDFLQQLDVAQGPPGSGGSRGLRNILGRANY